MKILHAIADLDRSKGGPAVACLGLAELMARNGHRVRVVATDRGFASEERDLAPGVEIEVFPGSWPAFFGTSWPLRKRLADAVREADVVHLHSLYLFHDWVCAHYCWRHGKPYIIEPHGTLDPYIYARHRWRKSVVDVLFQNRVLERAAGLHYTAAEEWRLARTRARNLRGAIVPIGIDLRQFDALPPRSALRDRFPAAGDRKVVLFLGRLSRKKGVDIVIEAFAEVARERDDIVLIIAGPDDGVRQEAEALIRERGLLARSLVPGMLGGRDKLALLAGSYVFLLPSQSENFGISVVEAAACAIPVVISEQVNIWRDFSDAKAGLTAPPNAQAFAAHLRYLLDNPAAATELGRRGAALVRSRFDWNALGRDYEAMYAQAARDGRLPVLE
ncbi:MAG TPA: glycosyltransferase [Stellaceae bacterium]|nr:glycosyltransferase [Stellaceae bacterium]